MTAPFLAKTNDKLCTVCKELKSIDEYYYSPSRNNFYPDCKKCRTEQTRVWRLNNPGKKREADLKRYHNITPAQYDALLDQQNGCCAICGKTEVELPNGRSSSGRSLYVDHDHRCCPVKGISCGKCIRGLLCDCCNRVLGFFKDDPQLFRKAISYLEKGWAAL